MQLPASRPYFIHAIVCEYERERERVREIERKRERDGVESRHVYILFGVRRDRDQGEKLIIVLQNSNQTWQTRVAQYHQSTWLSAPTDNNENGVTWSVKPWIQNDRFRSRFVTEVPWSAMAITPQVLRFSPRRSRGNHRVQFHGIYHPSCKTKRQELKAIKKLRCLWSFRCIDLLRSIQLVDFWNKIRNVPTGLPKHKLLSAGWIRKLFKEKII